MRAIGEMTVAAGGEEYRLRMSMLGISRLQDEYGKDLAPIMKIKDGELPHFGVFLRIIQVALERHHPEQANEETADDILSENPGVAAELIQATFPSDEGATKPTGKKKAARRST